MRHLIPAPLRRYLKLARIDRDLMAEIHRAAPGPHGLPAALIVNLTSYRPRFPQLHFALKSLLRQDMKPDCVILWVSPEDLPHLPGNVRALTKHGLEIRASENFGPHTKIIQALREFPDAYLITVDDDIIYPPTLISSLVCGHDEARPAILCRRAHRIRLSDAGFAPYMSWDHNVQDERSTEPSSDLMHLGVGGVFYPPGVLHADAIDVDQFRAISPRNDDLWLWWMGRRLDTPIKRVPACIDLDYVPGTQEVGLLHTNWDGGNDRQMAALLAAFGMADVNIATA